MLFYKFLNFFKGVLYLVKFNQVHCRVSIRGNEEKTIFSQNLPVECTLNNIFFYHESDHFLFLIHFFLTKII